MHTEKLSTAEVDLIAAARQMLGKQTIATCRPVDWTPMHKLLPLATETPVYPGSTVQQCSDCNCDIWVGPKVAEMLERSDSVKLCCFLCTFKYNPDMTVNLGNTYVRK